MDGTVSTAADGGDAIPAIEALIRKAHASSQRPSAARRMSGDAVRPRWMGTRDYVSVVSQLFHGEIATGRACGLLADRLTGSQAGRFLAIQHADEARHETIYRDYLCRLGNIAPVDPALDDATSAAATWTGHPAGIIAAFNIILEGEAVHLQQRGADTFPCPRFKAISRDVGRDEARHVAFGMLYLRNVVPTLDPDERVDMARWLKSLWFSVAPSRTVRASPLSAALRYARRRYLDERWPVHQDHLAKVGLVDADDRSG